MNLHELAAPQLYPNIPLFRWDKYLAEHPDCDPHNYEETTGKLKDMWFEGNDLTTMYILAIWEREEEQFIIRIRQDHLNEGYKAAPAEYAYQLWDRYTREPTGEEANYYAGRYYELPERMELSIPFWEFVDIWTDEPARTGR